MKETQFINQNKEKWQRLEGAIQNPDEKADELSDLFVQITDDLSYSRTFYPNRSIRAYLNWLAQRLFFKIYRTKRMKRSSFVHFWKEELPQIMYQSRWELLIAFGVFALSMVIGAFSSSMDPEFAKIILGERYIDMTEANIADGDPMAVYKDAGPFGMSLGIVANNLFVAFLTFVFGIFASVGAIGILVRNGVMVGVFQYFFYERGLLGESFLTIWTHGALEISAIVLAGAAGIVVGRGLLFPGTYHRMKAFQITANRGIKIMLGITPVIILAGIIESYLTRMTETPDILRLLFILLCFGFMIGYFVIFPYVKHKRGDFKKDLGYPELQPDIQDRISFDSIKDAGVIFGEILLLYRKYAVGLAKWALAFAFGFTMIIFLTADVPPDQIFVFTPQFGGGMQVLFQFLDFKTVFPLMNGIILAAAGWIGYSKIRLEKSATSKPAPSWYLILLVVIMLGFQLILFTTGQLSFLFFLLPIALPLVLGMASGLMFCEKEGLKGLRLGLAAVFQQFTVQIGLSFILLFLGFIFLGLVSSIIMWFLVDMFGMSFQFGNNWINLAVPVLFTFLTEFIIIWIFYGFFFGAALSWFSGLEIMEARSIKSEVDHIGTEKRIKGMLRE